MFRVILVGFFLIVLAAGIAVVADHSSPDCDSAVQANGGQVYRVSSC